MTSEPGNRSRKVGKTITPERSRFAAVLAVAAGLALLAASAAMKASAWADRTSAGAALVWTTDRATQSVTARTMLAQADNLGPPPSPDALVPVPPPPPLPETGAAPFPGYSWEPGHWVWNGTQYVWQPGNYIVQPTNNATFTPGHWQQYPGGWAWVDGRWNWQTQGEGE